MNTPNEVALHFLTQDMRVDGIGQTADEQGYIFVGYQGDEIIMGVYVEQNEYSTITKVLSGETAKGIFENMLAIHKKQFEEYYARQKELEATANELNSNAEQWEDGTFGESPRHAKAAETPAE